MKNRLFLDINVIQILPPSNINRDDTGSPKTAQYGGVRRARVSSQSWKKAMRDYFKENSEKSNIGVRTLKIVDFVAEKIVKLDPGKSYDEAMKLAEKVINDAGVKTAKSQAKALFFMGNSQAEKLANAALNDISDKKELTGILKSNPAIDIALFGRMVADDPSLNEDASCQVAHAISTHAVETEFDFFTAVDDLSKEDSQGAGMLGTVEYNSSTLYRYANVAVHEFLKQIGDKEQTVQSLKLLIEAFVNSLPTGKVNTFANTTLPEFVMISIRDDRPVNLVSAFENPVKAYKDEGYAKQSIVKLLKEYEKAEKFVDKAKYTSVLSLNAISNLDTDIVNEENLKKLLDNFANKLKGLLDDNQGE